MMKINLKIVKIKKEPIQTINNLILDPKKEVNQTKQLFYILFFIYSKSFFIKD